MQLESRTVRFTRYFILTSFAIGFVSSFAKPAHSAQEEASGIEYEVDLTEAENHYVRVTASFPSKKKEQRLFLPVWTPGSYLVREYARHIDSVSAVDSDGNTLKIKKVGKNVWLIEAHHSEATEVTYRLYCNELTVRTNFVDATFGLLNGAAVFLTADEFVDREHKVRLVLPPTWHQAVTSLERQVSLGPNVFVAKNFDELVDSPIVIGNPTLHSFEVGGVEHWLVNVGGEDLWDGNKAASDVAKIVATHQEMWGLVPYERYYFLNVIAEAGGGLEHDNSTVMLTSRWGFRDESRYKRWLGLVSHEFFHTWNVRRLRPRQLANYQYEVENYFEELWVAEGITSYYDDLALVRSGLVKPKEYLSGLSKTIKSVQTTEGRLRQSLAESSFDAWIKHYRPNENSRNTTISYYTKGAVVGFLLDIEIRRATKNKRSLDDVMRKLYEEYAQKSGYTNEDVKQCVIEIAGSDVDWEAWFEGAIYSAEELNYEPALKWLGMQFQQNAELESDDTPDENEAKAEDASESEKKDSEADASEEPAKEKSPKDELWTGMTTRNSDGHIVVGSVAEGSPAYKAGINVDDELIAINDYRISDSENQILEQLKDTESVQVLVARRGAIMTIELPLQRRPVKTWKLQILPNASDEQQANLNSWLHQKEDASAES